MDRIFVEIDRESYLENGEIKPVSKPIKEDELKNWFIKCERAQTPKGGFDIVRIDFICNLMNLMQSAKGRIISHILKNRKNDNTFTFTIEQLSKEIDVSIPTIVSTFQKLESAGLIKRKTKELMINPNLIHRGNIAREVQLMKMYENFDRIKRNV